MVKILIEYCGGWGYEPRYRELAGLIKSKVPAAEIVGQVGRRSSFEVTVDSQVIHSKLGTMAFPDFDEVAEIVESVNEGSSPRQVVKTVSAAGCILM